METEMKRINRTVALCFLVGVVLIAIACTKTISPDQMIRLSGPTMGTSYNITLNHRLDGGGLDTLHHEIDKILLGINNQMSTYHDDSELSRFNQNHTMEWVDVSSELFNVVKAAVYVSQMTHGAFDTTVGGLVNLWGFGPSIPSTIVPDDMTISRVMRVTGYEHLHLKGFPLALRKDVPALYVDLSGIAKGYAVDQIAQHLESVGISNYLVEIGGELRANGESQGGMVWEVVVERPIPLIREKYRIVQLWNRAIATSGDYRNYIERGGKRFSHTIDPNTGKPITHNLASVTVIHSSTMLADALATGLMVLGPDEGYDIAVHENLAALFLVKHEDGFREKVTPALDRYMSRK